MRGSDVGVTKGAKSWSHNGKYSSSEFISGISRILGHLHHHAFVRSYVPTNGPCVLAPKSAKCLSCLS